MLASYESSLATLSEHFRSVQIINEPTSLVSSQGIHNLLRFKHVIWNECIKFTTHREIFDGEKAFSQLTVHTVFVTISIIVLHRAQ